jgi:hypothetical protein
VNRRRKSLPRAFANAEYVTPNVREGLKPASATKLSLKVAQNEQKRSKSRKQKLSLSYGWLDSDSLI